MIPKPSLKHDFYIKKALKDFSLSSANCSYSALHCVSSDQDLASLASLHLGYQACRHSVLGLKVEISFTIFLAQLISSRQEAHIWSSEEVRTQKYTAGVPTCLLNLEDPVSE